MNTDFLGHRGHRGHGEKTNSQFNWTGLTLIYADFLGQEGDRFFTFFAILVLTTRGFSV